MGQESALTRPEQLMVYRPSKSGFDQPEDAKTPNEWFVQRYPQSYDNHGSPFLELVETIDSFSHQILSISLNHDFFASVLGGRRDLGHHVIYFEPEMEWYFRDSDQICKTTTAEKLMNLYRALMMKCCEEMPRNVHKLNLFHEFRSDRNAKLVVQRAKAVLAADSSFFSAQSPNQRIRGIEIVERVARKFVVEWLSAEPGQTLKLAEAHSFSQGLLKERDLHDVKRSDFKAVVGPMITQSFNVCLRNDLDGTGVRGWKGVKLLSVPSHN